MTKFGIGTLLYFKMLKFMIVMFLLAIVINIPIFVLYAGTGGIQGQSGNSYFLNIFKGLKYNLAGISLAYTGENTRACNLEEVNP